MADRMSQVTITSSNEKQMAVFTFKSDWSTTTYEIKADKYGLFVSVQIVGKDGLPKETQLGVACENRTTAHIDAL